jgi:hypothetical protein
VVGASDIITVWVKPGSQRGPLIGAGINADLTI